MAIRTTPRNIYAGKDTEVKVMCVNEKEAFQGKLVVEVVSEHNNKEAIIESGIEGDEILALMKPPDSLINP